MASRIATLLGIFAMLSSSGAWAASCIRQTGRLGGGPADAVVSSGNHAVLGTGSRLVTVDVSDPDAPTTLSDVALGTRWPTPGTTCVTPLAGLDDLAVVSESCGDRSQLMIVDLSEPSSPTVASTIALFDNAEHAVAIGNIVWVSAPVPVGDVVYDTVTAIDLTDPGAPVTLGQYRSRGAVFDLAAAGDILGVLEAPPLRMTLVDVRSPADPAVLSQTEVDNTAAALELAGHRAYLATRESIETWDISDPALPSPETSVWWMRIAAPTDLIAVGDRLFLGLLNLDPQIADASGGLEVFDLADPGNVWGRSTIAFSSGSSQLAEAGRLLVVADRGRGLRVFDPDAMSSPIRPGLVNPTFDEVVSVAVAGDLAYLADHGLRVVDLAGAPEPTVIGSLELDTPLVYDPTAGVVTERDRYAWDVAAADGTVVLSTSDGALEVIDVSDPRAPVAQARLALGLPAGSACRVALSRPTAAIVGDDPDGLILIDLSEPSNPIEVGRATPSGRPTDVEIIGDLAVVTFGPWPAEPDRGGIDIFDISHPDAPVALAALPFDQTTTAVAALGAEVIAVGRDGVHVVDLSDPGSPEEIGALTAVPGPIFDVAVSGNTAFVPFPPGGLAVVDIVDLAEPALVTYTSWQPWYAPDGGPYGGLGVAVWHGRAVVADGTFGVRILDRSRCRDLQPAPLPTAVGID